jgi:hypothetical protein
MSYGAAAALQAAIYVRLIGWADLAGIPVVDAMPAGSAPETFVLMGPELVADQSDKTGGGAEHRLEISVISTATGFLAAKTVAAAVSAALADAPLDLLAERLVGLSFQRAVARRLDQGAVRRIDLTFRARIEF